MSDEVAKKGERHHASQLCSFIDECLSGKREVRNLLFSIWSPWCKLVKREFLIDNQITFATTPISEDVIWCTRIAVHSKKAEVSGDCIYCLTERKGSLTSDVSVKKFTIWCNVLKERNTYLHKYHYDEYYFYFGYDELIFLRKKGSIHLYQVLHKMSPLWHYETMCNVWYRGEASFPLPLSVFTVKSLGFPKNQ